MKNQEWIHLGNYAMIHILQICNQRHFYIVRTRVITGSKITMKGDGSIVTYRIHWKSNFANAFVHNAIQRLIDVRNSGDISVLMGNTIPYSFDLPHNPPPPPKSRNTTSRLHL